MKRPLGRNPTLLVGAAIALWASTGCPSTEAVTGEDTLGSAREAVDEGETENRAPRAAARAGAEAEDGAAWPEGWLVVHHEEWIPVLDELGRRLHAARRAFQGGDRAAAGAEVHRGLDILEVQRSGASERDGAALESASATLQAVAARLSGDGEVTLEQLDIAFANAYRANLEREALVVETESAELYLDRPAAHLQRAVALFLADEQDEAAREVDRASAYLRLEGNRLEVGERARLTEAAQGLERVAARLRLKEIGARDELDRVFVPALEGWRQHARTPASRSSPGLMR